MQYFCEFQFRPGFPLKVVPNNAESWRARSATKTIEILTILSSERPVFNAIANISQVLQYFCEFQFRPRFTLKVVPNNAESWRARNATKTNDITFCEFQFRPRFTLKVAPNNAESWRARNATENKRNLKKSLL